MNKYLNKHKKKKDPVELSLRNDRGIVKWLLIGLCAVFLVVLLVLPLVYVIVTAIRD